jgi:hypothetical protein
MHLRMNFARAFYFTLYVQHHDIKSLSLRTANRWQAGNNNFFFALM